MLVGKDNSARVIKTVTENMKLLSAYIIILCIAYTTDR